MYYEDWLDKLAVQGFTTIDEIVHYIEDPDKTPEEIYETIPNESIDEKADYLLSYFRDSEMQWPVEESKVVEKQKLRLVIADNSSSKEYVNFLSEIYDVTVVKHGDEADLVLFTGGEDVYPKYYAENTGKFTSYNERRDKLEQNVYSMYRYTPKLGICRGNQFLAVMKGGKLIQHVSGHGQSHYITTNSGMNIEVTSTHHQMVYPFDLPQDRYELIGWSKNFRSGTYLNGNNEEIDLHRDFLEVEIIKWGNDALGIQGHPEYSSASPQFKKYALQLIQKLIGEYGEKSLSSKYTTRSIQAPKSLGWYDNMGVQIKDSGLRFIDTPTYGQDFYSTKGSIEALSGKQPNIQMKEEVGFDVNQFNNFYKQELEKQIIESKENSLPTYNAFNIENLENVLNDLSKNKK